MARAQAQEKVATAILRSINAGQVMEQAFYFEAVNDSNADIAANWNLDDIEPVLLKNADYTLSYSIGKQKKASVTKENGAVEEVVYLPVTYSGKALKPEIIFRENATGRIVNFKQGVADTVTYQNTTKASAESTSSSQPRATVKVKGNGWVMWYSRPSSARAITLPEIRWRETLSSNKKIR